MKYRLPIAFIVTITTAAFISSCGSHGGGYNIAAVSAHIISTPTAATLNTTGLCTGSLSIVTNPVSANYSISNSAVIPPIQLMYGSFTSSSGACGPGNFGGVVVPAFTTITSANGLPSAALQGSSGIYYTYSQTTNGTISSTGTVTWALAANGQTITYTNTNLSYPSGATNYTFASTYTFNPSNNTSSLSSVAITIPGSNGGTINGVASSVTMPALNWQAAYQAFITGGWSNNFNVAGACTGTLSMTQGVVSSSATTFNGATAYPAAYQQVGNLTGSNPICSTVSQTNINYYSSNLTSASPVQLGNATPSIYTAVTALPTSLSAGPNTGTQYTFTQTTNSQTGSIVFAAAPPASSSTQPVLFTYSLNVGSDGVTPNYGTLAVYSINANSVLTQIGYGYSDVGGNNLTAN